MRFGFEKVTDTTLIPATVLIIYLKKNFEITTSKLIEELRNSSEIPAEDKKILKNRSDDIFSQKVRNLISHKILENFNLALIEKNLIKLSKEGIFLAKKLKDNFYKENFLNYSTIDNFEEFHRILFKIKNKLDYDPILLDRLANFDFSERATTFFDNMSFKFIGDLCCISEKEIKSSRNVGKKTYNEIKNFLYSKNLSFNCSPSSWSHADKKNLIVQFAKIKSKKFTSNIDELLEKNIIKTNNETDELFLRKKAIIEARFGLKNEFLTLEEIGAKFSVSRERIRQISQKFISKIKSNEEIKNAVKNLHSKIKSLTPIDEKTLNSKLINLGFFLNYKSFLCIRNLLTLLDKFEFDHYELDSLGHLEASKDGSLTFLVSNKKELKILSKIVSNSRKLTNQVSYCNFSKLIFDLFKSDESKFNIIKESLKNHPYFYWFDEDNYYVLDSSVDRQKILNILKKLTTFNKKITFQSFSDSLINNNRIKTSPPLNLLKSICKINGFKIDDNYIYSNGDDNSLTELESNIVKMFRENGDYLSFWEAYELLPKYNIARGSFNLFFYASSIVQKLDNGIFCLFGTDYDIQKIKDAEDRSEILKKNDKNIDLDINYIQKSIKVEFNLSRYTKERGTIIIPANWKKFLNGTYYVDNESSDYKIVINNGVGMDFKKIYNEFKINSRVKLLFSFNPNTVKVI